MKNKPKFITIDDIVDILYDYFQELGYNISRSNLRDIIIKSDEIRRDQFIQGNIIDLGFGSINSKVRNVNSNISVNEGFTVKISGSLYKDTKNQCMKIEKAKLNK